MCVAASAKRVATSSLRAVTSTYEYLRVFTSNVWAITSSPRPRRAFVPQKKYEKYGIRYSRNVCWWPDDARATATYTHCVHKNMSQLACCSFYSKSSRLKRNHCLVLIVFGAILHAGTLVLFWANLFFQWNIDCCYPVRFSVWGRLVCLCVLGIAVRATLRIHGSL